MDELWVKHYWMMLRRRAECNRRGYYFKTSCQDPQSPAKVRVRMSEGITALRWFPGTNSTLSYQNSHWGRENITWRINIFKGVCTLSFLIYTKEMMVSGGSATRRHITVSFCVMESLIRGQMYYLFAIMVFRPSFPPPFLMACEGFHLQPFLGFDSWLFSYVKGLIQQAEYWPFPPKQQKKTERNSLTIVVVVKPPFEQVR